MTLKRKTPKEGPADDTIMSVLDKEISLPLFLAYSVIGRHLFPGNTLRTRDGLSRRGARMACRGSSLPESAAMLCVLSVSEGPEL